MFAKYFRKITIIRTEIPQNENINVELQWLGSSLGLFSQRDKDRSCFRIFIELLKSSKENKKLSSDELAYKLNLSRGTVIHHINNLFDKGIVVYEDTKYTMRVSKLVELIEELKKESMKSFDRLINIADKIDKRLEKI